MLHVYIYTEYLVSSTNQQRSPNQKCRWMWFQVMSLTSHCIQFYVVKRCSYSEVLFQSISCEWICVYVYIYIMLKLYTVYRYNTYTNYIHTILTRVISQIIMEAITMVILLAIDVATKPQQVMRWIDKASPSLSMTQRLERSTCRVSNKMSRRLNDALISKLD